MPENQHMKYADLLKMSVKDVHAFILANPTSIAALNALRQLLHKERQEAILRKLGNNTVSGQTKPVRPSLRGPRCPTKRELR